jgi:hypothetical protein
MAKGIAYKILQKFDVLFKYVSPTVNTKDPYRTLLGGITTLIIFFIMFGYFIYLVAFQKWTTDPIGKPLGLRRDLGSMNQTTRNLVEQDWEYELGVKKTFVSNYIWNDTTVYKPFVGGFMIAVKPTYFAYDPSMYTIDYFNSTLSANTRQEVRQCTFGDFPFELRDELEAINITTWLCPATYTYTIQGSRKKSENYVNFMIGLSKCSSYFTDCINEDGISMVGLTENLQYMWVEGEYNYADPSTPVKYILRTGQEINWDATSADFVYMNWQINEVYDIDGRVKTFYKMRDDVDYYYAWYSNTALPHIVTFFMGVEEDITRYTQYYKFKISGAARNLEATEVVESTIVTTTINGMTESIFFAPFFILSQLGGLYAILVLIFGLIISPIIHKLFLRDSLQKIYEYEKKRRLNIHGENSPELNELENERLENFDLILNSLCCCLVGKSKKYEAFNNKVNSFNKSRDLIDIINQLKIMDCQAVRNNLRKF